MACNGAWQPALWHFCPLLQSALFMRSSLRRMHVLAEKSWKQRNAEAMDMEVSSDDEDENAPAAQNSRKPQQANDGSSLAYMQRVSREP